MPDEICTVVVEVTPRFKKGDTVYTPDGAAYIVEFAEWCSNAYPPELQDLGWWYHLRRGESAGDDTDEHADYRHQRDLSLAFRPGC